MFTTTNRLPDAPKGISIALCFKEIDGLGRVVSDDGRDCVYTGPERTPEEIENKLVRAIFEHFANEMPADQLADEVKDMNWIECFAELTDDELAKAGFHPSDFAFTNDGKHVTVEIPIDKCPMADMDTHAWMTWISMT